ncbi:hypothetical protein FHR75_002541 [Kineococcus radiotolerans]|uniref:DUF4349 domain-containing protein n=1 Tax=Kineococcus radiotolerans TaxID=131568 RepID=A0A7W4XX39_KINRA|nr:DUF4349 domain-containing protein [Kineococcus radiotolerans]MBB2901726.1 hypothetical protein [Kineococcus radiotolerans]
MPALTPLSPTRAPARRRTALAVPALLAALLLGATACSGSGSDSGGGSSAADSAPAAGGGSGESSGADSGAAVAALDSAGTAAAAPAADPAALAGGAARAVVSTATLGVEVADPAAAQAAVEDLVTTAGGVVAASRAGGSGEPDGEHARLTLRVPSAAFDGVLDGIAALGRQTERSTSATDVTAEVADVDSRVASARAVLATFRDQLPQARTIADVLAVEGEIARRQADLEALQARQRVLADQVALATVEVTLTREAATAAVAAGEPGFTGGLVAGWRALGESLRVVSVVVGALIPFAVPLALVAVPLLLRRRRTRGTASPAPAE